jgi:Holliday junction resolvase
MREMRRFRNLRDLLGHTSTAVAAKARASPARRVLIRAVCDIIRHGIQEDMDTKTKAHVLFEATQHLGWSDSAEIAQFVRRLERGLPAEDELSVIFHWLGQCKLVHKLDQLPYPPDVWKHYRVPDLLAVFDVRGASVPVLIEVKASLKPFLSWRPDYTAALQRYADLIGLPLLIAWKFGMLWTLFEAKLLRKAKKNLKISFLDALPETLLCLLAGDFSFSFLPGVGAYLKIRKLLETEDGFRGQIEEAYFLNANGERHTGADGLFQLFACSDNEASLQEDATHAVQSFIVQPSGHAQFAHQALPRLLAILGERQGSPTWRQVLLKKELPQLVTSPQRTVRSALDAGFVQRIVRIQPKTAPAFLC